jgi:FPC/CPF motif-containing protein YcgG
MSYTSVGLNRQTPEPTAYGTKFRHGLNCSVMKNIIAAHTRAVSNGRQLVEDFRAFVSDRDFPCVGAKSALARNRMEFAVYDQLGTDASAQGLRHRLAHFSARHPHPGVDPISFVAIFREQVASEEDFHERLWRQLQAVHDLDIEEHPWAAGVSDDPASARFSFSVAGRAFFVVGLHPASSRLSRRAPQPTLVFNFHNLFETLRVTGRYDKLQAAIRSRDRVLQGNINPMLARFGEASEALQYSGLADGQCPFHPRSSSH